MPDQHCPRGGGGEDAGSPAAARPTRTGEGATTAVCRRVVVGCGESPLAALTKEARAAGESGGAAELDPERMARSVPGSSQVGEEVANGGGRRTADGCS